MITDRCDQLVLAPVCLPWCRPQAFTARNIRFNASRFKYEQGNDKEGDIAKVPKGDIVRTPN